MAARITCRSSLQHRFPRRLHGSDEAGNGQRREDADDRHHDHQLHQRKARVLFPDSCACRLPTSREYLVPSRAVPCDFEYTSKTLCPPKESDVGSSCIERSPHSALPVIGSIRNAAQKRHLLPLHIHAIHQRLQVRRIVLAVHLGLECAAVRRILVVVDRVAHLPQIAAQLALPLSRFTLKRATGTAAEARIARIATVTISSISVRPRSAAFSPWPLRSSSTLHLTSPRSWSAPGPPAPVAARWSWRRRASILIVVFPAALAWKFRTQTTPAPLTPAAPGGRDALI